MYMNLSLQIFLVWAKVSGAAGASARKKATWIHAHHWS